MLHFLVIAGLMSLATVASAQDPVVTDPDKYRVILENDCVRVLDYADRPGEKTHPHRHPSFVLYALSPFSRRLLLDDGRVLQRQFGAGEAMWSPAQVHIGENIGDTPTRVIIVEMKPGAGGCVAQ
ncbi:hypothetical protein [Thauera sp.]|jgi:hypothetical protein|uniref:hypothetical protein n=1 Tax=Thauera sp. TaxID=1905334 RepID=UPI002A366EC6|nr:hypothetical protein [Thauera sp.]MDX9887102.1 hypothetical protein [Thauera sp.]